MPVVLSCSLCLDRESSPSFGAAPARAEAQRQREMSAFGVGGEQRLEGKVFQRKRSG